MTFGHTMNEMDTTLMLLFWGAMAINVVTLAIFLTARNSPWLSLTPWIGLSMGIAWFTYCRSYFARPEVSLDVPIRIDLILLPPLMAFALYAGVIRIIRKARKNTAEDTT